MPQTERLLNPKDGLLSLLSVHSSYTFTMRILVVEDEPKIGHALKKGLQQEHYAVDHILDGKEGLAMALSEPYDLIILDRMLPNISDGLQLCQQVRQKGLHMPILMLTAKTQVNDRVEGLENGADDYLAKPFAFEELLARVRALLRRPEQRLEAALEVGDVALDPSAFSVTRSGKPILLSSKEFALLEYLMRNSGRTVTKEMIISHVWDYDADILPNTVEVYIGYLRNKLERPFKRAFITTARGFGYRVG